jgi:hypothetical protein
LTDADNQNSPQPGGTMLRRFRKCPYEASEGVTVSP